MMFSDPPYLIVPQVGEGISHEDLVRDLPDAAEIKVCYPKDMPLSFDASMDSGTAVTLVQVTQWIFALAPHTLRDLIVWVLATTAGTAFTKGFASEAGKAAFNGIKALAKRVKTWSTRKKNQPIGILPLRVEAERITSGGVRQNFALTISPEWLDTEDSVRFFQLEQQILPVACTFLTANDQMDRTNEFTEAETAAFSIEIGPASDGPDTWTIFLYATIRTRVLVVVDCVLSQYFTSGNKQWEQVGVLAERLFECLSKHGFSNRYGQSLVGH